MKKVIALLAAAVIMSSASAFAAWSTPAGDGTYSYSATNVGTNVAFITKLSANVKIKYNPDTANGTFYTIGTHHTSGTKSYATSSGDSRLFMKENAAQATAAEPPDAAATPDWTGWTAVK